MRTVHTVHTVHTYYRAIPQSRTLNIRVKFLYETLLGTSDTTMKDFKSHC